MNFLPAGWFFDEPLFLHQMNKYLIVGLGNIGAEYAHTRHNIGFDVVNAFAHKHGATFNPGRLADVAEVKIKGRTITCIKPTTYMNLSGKAFKYWLDKTNTDITNTLTIVDDLALPLSKVRLRGAGSDAGHNGLKDIQATLGSDRYPKMRFGIGNDYPKGMQVDFVLGKWNPDEQPVVARKIDKCCEAIENFVFLGLEKTMNLINSAEFV